MFYLLALGCLATALSYVAAHCIIRLAPRWDLMDRPDGHHKCHDREVALGGGLAVFLAASVTLCVGVFSSEYLRSLFARDTWLLEGLLIACGWIVALGLYDDRFGMRGRYKVLGQVVAVMIVIAAGLEIRGFSLFGYNVQLGLLSIPFTMFWLLGAINALNLLDGLDGLATTIGIILCATITAMATMFGRPEVAMVGAVFIGSLVGFLRWNYPPARMLLGDAGSMLIGLVVGSLAICGSLKGPATVAMAAPLAIWAIPIFDSAAAILRRKLSGRSVFATDRGHLHHLLMSMFGSNPRVLAVVAISCAVTCVGALISVFMGNDLLALLSVLSVLCTLVVTKAFGHIEFVMLITRIKSLVLSKSPGKAEHEYSFQMQGDREWQFLWESVIEIAKKTSLVRVVLDVNLVADQEGFHASWSRPSKTELPERWNTEIPLFSGTHVIGRLRLVGVRALGVTSCETIAELMELLEPVELEIVDTADHLVPEEVELTAKLDQLPSTSMDPALESMSST
ncbi:MraY family glycosyltransferase [Bythopirellula polymerisocia]|uniref:WecA-like glycosyltransferase n=1 Tax=Bythopirellula polymerisocia TaxID=2528003 RepID=A0A5C6CMI7_9BACT|nr:MraY family glycosyltransferase [Bythopirellula polymerisocia]TWU25810.1 WecA-like glycosyltransferase [Bythopirellula polymerisocia]